MDRRKRASGGTHPHKRLYDSAAWKVRRADQLRREPLCRYCAQRGKRTRATLADHIEPHRGDLEKFYRGELQSLCSACHSSDKQREENGGGRVGSDVDGFPLSPLHHWNREPNA